MRRRSEAIVGLPASTYTATFYPPTLLRTGYSARKIPLTDHDYYSKVKRYRWSSTIRDYVEIAACGDRRGLDHRIGASKIRPDSSEESFRRTA